MPSKYNKKNLFWLDFEMTGLSPKKDKILDVAAVITDYDFNILETYDSAVLHDKSIVNQMDDFVLNMHTTSGLLDRLSEGKPLETIEAELQSMLFRHFPNYESEKVIMAGNTIQIDRDFLLEHMKILGELIHYRVVDVSTLRMIYMCKYNKVYQKDPSKHHMAVEDILSSIEELKYYLAFVNI